jgi:hypothetical protein
MRFGNSVDIELFSAADMAAPFQFGPYVFSGTVSLEAKQCNAMEDCLVALSSPHFSTSDQLPPGLTTIRTAHRLLRHTAHSKRCRCPALRSAWFAVEDLDYRIFSPVVDFLAAWLRFFFRYRARFSSGSVRQVLDIAHFHDVHCAGQSRM